MSGLRATGWFAFLVCAWSAASGVRAAEASGDWPQFRGPSADGHAPADGLNLDWKAKPPQVAWQRPLHDGGYAGPAAAGGRLYIVDHEGAQDIVLCLDLATGKEVWRFAYPDAEKSNYGFARATPAVDGNRVFVLGRLGFLACLDAATGAKVWTADAVADLAGERPKWGYCASPVVDGDRLLIETGGKSLLTGLDKATGKEIWRGGGQDAVSFATPVIARLDGRKQYLIFSGRRLAGVDAESGAVAWSLPWQTKYPNHIAGPVAVSENTVFLTSGYGRGCGLVEVKGPEAKLRWESTEIISRISTPVLHQGLIYCTGEHGGLACLDPATGKTVWKQPGFGWGGLIAAGDRLFVVDDKTGKVTQVKLGSGKYEEAGVCAPPLGAVRNVWTAPILAGGHLVVRSANLLVAINLK